MLCLHAMAADTLMDVEIAAARLSLAVLLERYHACARSGHAWRPLDAPQLTAGTAEWCGGCLRVRTRCFEGWLTCPQRGEVAPATRLPN